jgi:outer membrane PBP1 activator LpoA protein
MPTPRAARLLAGMLLATAAALCGAQSPPTSDARAAPLPPAEFGPPRPSAAVPRFDIALVLPLEAPAYARAADAVRAGFMAAAEAAGVARRCLVIGHGDDGVIPSFDAARDRGVRVIVGPLVRDDLKTLGIAGGQWPTTIALNQLDDGSPLPSNTWSLALTVESDARMLARRAFDDGAKTVDVVEDDSALTRRLASAFAAEWTGIGGMAPSDYPVTGSREALLDLRKSLARAPPDAVLLATSGEQAALVKPFLPNLTAYASGLVFERPLAAAARDLDDVRVAEIPWILTPDAPELASLPRREFGSAALTRLYALGLDAFRVAQAFLGGVPERLSFDGATGHISLDARRQLERESRMGIYRDGQLVPLERTR